MTSLLALAMLLLPLASAQEDPNAGNREQMEGGKPAPIEAKNWSVMPYWEPVSNLQFIQIRANDIDKPEYNLQGEAGGAAGVRYRFHGDPYWFGFSRIGGSLRYSLLYGTMGIDGRVGSFFGIDPPRFRLYSGPDLFYNQYGFNGRGDVYFLAPTAGVAWDTHAYFKVTREFWIGGSAAPAWLHKEERHADDLPLFHELTIKGTLMYLGRPKISAGYFWSKTSAGVIQGVILSSDF